MFLFITGIAYDISHLLLAFSGLLALYIKENRTILTIM